MSQGKLGFFATVKALGLATLSPEAKFPQFGWKFLGDRLEKTPFNLPSRQASSEG